MKYWINSDGLEEVNASKLKEKLAFTFSNNIKLTICKKRLDNANCRNYNSMRCENSRTFSSAGRATDS